MSLQLTWIRKCFSGVFPDQIRVVMVLLGIANQSALF